MRGRTASALREEFNLILRVSVGLEKYLGAAEKPWHPVGPEQALFAVPIGTAESQSCPN